MQNKHLLFISIISIVCSSRVLQAMMRKSPIPAGQIDKPKDKETGDTRLHLEVLYGQVFGVRELLEDNKANPNVKNVRKQTPLILAAKVKQGKKNAHDIAQLLVDHGAKVDETDDKARTALHYACMRQTRRMVELLLSKGARTDLKDKDGKTPRDVDQMHLIKDYEESQQVAK